MLGDTVHFLLAESGVEAPEGAVLRPAQTNFSLKKVK